MGGLMNSRITSGIELTPLQFAILLQWAQMIESEWGRLDEDETALREELREASRRFDEEDA